MQQAVSTSMVIITVGHVLQAMLAVGAGSLAVNAVKGVLGGGDKGDEEVSKAAKKVGSNASDDGISKALESLRKSGKALPCPSVRVIPCFTSPVLQSPI